MASLDYDSNSDTDDDNESLEEIHRRHKDRRHKARQENHSLVKAATVDTLDANITVIKAYVDECAPW